MDKCNKCMYKRFNTLSCSGARAKYQVEILKHELSKIYPLKLLVKVNNKPTESHIFCLAEEDKLMHLINYENSKCFFSKEEE